MMRKLFCTSIFLIAFSAIVSAQKTFDAGLWAGPVTSQISGDGMGGWDKFGFGGGGWVRRQLSDTWSITGGLQYIQKGARSKKDTLTFFMFGYHLEYIELPLMAGYHKGNWEFNLGITAGLLISQEIRTNTVNTEVDPPFLPWEFGGLAGATFWFSDHFGLGIRGLSSITPTRPTPNFANQLSYYERGNYNRAIQFLLNYRF